MDEYSYNIKNYADEDFDDEKKGIKGSELSLVEKKIILQNWRIADMEYAVQRAQAELRELEEELAKEKRDKK